MKMNVDKTIDIAPGKQYNNMRRSGTMACPVDR